MRLAFGGFVARIADVVRLAALTAASPMINKGELVTRPLTTWPALLLGRNLNDDGSVDALDTQLEEVTE